MKATNSKRLLTSNRQLFRIVLICGVSGIFILAGVISLVIGVGPPAYATPEYCEACEDDPPPPECPCGDCVNGCSGGCTDNDNDGICDDSDNCVGYEGVEYEEVCERYCEDENPYTGECDQWFGWDCEIVGSHQSCTPY